MSAAIVAVTSTAATNASAAAAAANRARQKHCNEVLSGFQHDQASPEGRYEYARCIVDFHKPTQPATTAEMIFIGGFFGGLAVLAVLILVAMWRMR